MILALAALASAAVCVGDPVRGWGCREAVAGWEVLDLHGTDTQLGWVYGTLMRGEMEALYVPMLEREHYGALPHGFRSLFLRVQRRFPDYFDAPARARAAGLDAALGLPAGSMERYAWFTDLSSVGPALMLATARTLQLDPRTGEVSARCTSVVGDDVDGTVHARNLDLWGMGYWQPNAALTFVDPRTPDGAPDGYRYAHVGALGEVFAGSTGVNEPGLTVTTHLHVTPDVALVDGRARLSPLTLWWESWRTDPARGTSVYVLFERLMRRAADVEAAIALLRDERSVGAWSFVLSDPSGGRAVVGINARATGVTRGADVLTNQYLDEGMHAREYVPVRGPVEGARQRFRRARAMLDAARPDGFTVPEAVSILRDRADLATGTRRVTSPNLLVSVDTNQSAVVKTRPDGDHEIWLAVPHADGYVPAPLAEFVGFRFRDRAPIGGIAFDEPPDAVLAAYVDAMRLQLDEKDPAAALARLRGIPSDDPGIRLMAAWLAASLGEHDVAARERERAEASPLPMTPHHRVLSAWLAAELARASGERRVALLHYAEMRARIAADTSEDRDLNAILDTVAATRIAEGARGRLNPFPSPDLKFQDVLEIRE
ncbi:MAG: carcinine hydrolase/isopenicillin-N N-acyltransferase family protein [Myxococcota bacterium]